MNKLDFRLFKQSIALAKPYWISKEKGRAWLLLALILVLLVGDTQFNVWFNVQSGEFTSALAARDGARFWHSIRIFFLLIAVAVPIYGFYYFVRDKLALSWRRWLTNWFLDRYFRNHAFYQLLAKPEIDNPDQRMSEDVAGFTTESMGFLLTFAGGLLQLAAFSHVLWGISHYLMYLLLVYAATATLVTFGVFGEKMAGLYYNQRRREADFRFGLVRVRENAESIALYHGERQEKGRVRRLFKRLFENSVKLIRWQLGLNFFQYSQSLLIMMIPSIIIAPRVLSGQLEVGRVVQAEGAFASVMGALTILLDNVENLSRFAAGVGRLTALAHTKLPASTAATLERRKITVREGKRLRFDEVTLETPNYERTLVKNLTVAVPRGQGLMIVGGSGLGKSSLLRLMAGLWDSGEGMIERPSPENILFLPQHAYMTIGSLRGQLQYPDVERRIPDTELRRVLKRVNLPEMEERCGGFDADFDFEKILSVGERQRLAFARVLLKQPHYVLLDEATSALDRDNEAALYSQLTETAITVVSVSHHPALVKHHAQVLELRAHGTWVLHPAKKFQFSEDLTYA